MSNIPGNNGTQLPSADLDIRPAKYLKAFERWTMAENDAMHLAGLTEQELELCRIVDKAYSRIGEECPPKQQIMKSAMEISKGSASPVDIRIMIDATYNFYYGVTDEWLEKCRLK